VLLALVDHGYAVHIDATDVTDFLQNNDPFIRQQAVMALQQAGGDGAVTPLLRHLHDPDSRVALAAAHALGDVDDLQVADPLYAVAVDETAYYQLRGEAIASLVRVGASETNQRLMGLLDDPDVYIRQRVVELIRIVETEAEARKLLNTADSHRSLVTPVRQALTRAGGPAVEAVMLESLTHLRTWVRSLAVEVLGELGSGVAVEPLLALLRDDVPEVRVLAANALGQIRAKMSIDGLADALDDPNWLVEMAAASALRRINTVRAQAALDAWRRNRGG
ncbi:MAG: HEAT repeat domain-containing protein, partial [Chloroflexota bacterium]